ncbi:TPA: excinuclease ABC subunit C, partial [Candidatus Micrarchaeota archaeon]|nr:excinuclease ABC subunit C [Candidatus Micrarchaeota archaeon]
MIPDRTAMGKLPERLAKKLASLPDSPGVYLFLGERGEVIYVGKSVSLRSRVRSYFQGSASPKAREIAAEAADLEYIVTNNEAEALILEDALIKKHRPRFNVRLRDDKRYPYVKITSERFPRILVVRAPENDGAKYFGPFTSTRALKGLLSLLQRVAPLRTCNLDLDSGKPHRPCLYFHLGRCPAPCAGRISPEDYRLHVEKAEKLLSGRTAELIGEIEERMREAAAAERFEEAAKLRDLIRDIERIHPKQAVALPEAVDMDAVGLHFEGDRGAGVVLLVRGGRLIGREGFPLVVPGGSSPEEALAEFLDQYYTHTTSTPQEVLLPWDFPESKALEEYLSRKRGQKVSVRVPRRGARRELVDMAQKNAELLSRRLAAEDLSSLAGEE